MYHKLVAQNSGLKALTRLSHHLHLLNDDLAGGVDSWMAMLHCYQVEVTENDKKIQRKDLRIQQLEKNLREATIAATNMNHTWPRDAKG